MTNLDVLIASWRARRAFLLQQLEQLQRGGARHGEVRRVGLERQEVDLVHQDIQCIESWIANLDELLAQHHS
jgi:hypothetical protein